MTDMLIGLNGRAMATGEHHTADGNLPNNHVLFKDRILAEQVKQVYILAPIGFVATVFNSLLVFFVMKDVMRLSFLVPWVSAVLSVTMLRMGLVLWFRSVEFEPSASERWAKLFIVSLLIVGIAWGCIGFFPFAGISLAHHVFLAFVLGGMAAGASSTFSMLRLGYAAFSIPALLPLALHFFLIHETFHYAMGAMVTLFGILLWRISEHNYRVNRTSLVLRFQNMGMIEGLKQAKERVERLNAQLTSEIEARHKAEADLRTHHEQLERVVQQRTADLTAVNRELELFAYMASHDLQEPLRMVTSYLQLLRQKYSGRLDEKADLYIRYAVDGGFRMQKLIDGLLSYSRLSHSAEFSQVDVNAAFSVAVTNLAPTISEKSAVVTKDPLPTVLGDEIQLQLLLQNLISNGLKYTKADIVPQVHVSAEKQGDAWVFSVADNGIGIDPGEFDKIFQIFHRLHTREEYPGTGIGLASCKKIVERHGGDIWVRSRPGEGSIFSFKIPADRSREPTRRSDTLEE